jgi:hypothetical protein
MILDLALSAVTAVGESLSRSCRPTSCGSAASEAERVRCNRGLGEAMVRSGDMGDKRVWGHG